jgi:hypothetical protein
MKEEGKMTCVEFWVWLGSGVVIVPLLAWLKTLPRVGAIFEQWAWIVAPLLAAVLPQVASLVQPYCAKLDPLLWTAIYAGLSYLVSQLLYWLAKKSGVKV